MTRDQELRVAAAGLGGWDVIFCPVCGGLVVLATGNPDLAAHCREAGDDEHLVLEVLET